MNISLTPKLEEVIQERVKSGMYRSASEFLRESLRYFLRQEKSIQEERRVRHLIEEGLQTQSAPLESPEELIKMAKEKYSS